MKAIYLIIFTSLTATCYSQTSTFEVVRMEWKDTKSAGLVKKSTPVSVLRLNKIDFEEGKSRGYKT